jgi:hypothetical protein
VQDQKPAAGRDGGCVVVAVPRSRVQDGRPPSFASSSAGKPGSRNATMRVRRNRAFYYNIIDNEGSERKKKDNKNAA